MKGYFGIKKFKQCGKSKHYLLKNVQVHNKAPKAYARALYHALMVSVSRLFNSNGFSQVTWLIHITAPHDGDMIRQQL